MSNDGKHFHSDSKQHVLNGVYDKNNRHLRVSVFQDPPFRPSDIVANVSPLEVALDSFPLPLNPYPIAVIEAVDNDINDSHDFQIVDNPSGVFKLIKNPTSGVYNILTVTSEIEEKNPSPGDTLSVTVRTCDTFGLCLNKTIDVDIVATASVVGPTKIILEERSVKNLSSSGFIVTSLSATGGILPYNFSIVDDPDSKFQIIGGDLLLSDTVDRRDKIRHDVTLRVTDGNGSTFDTRYTISVVESAQPSDTGLINISLSDSTVETGSTTGELVGILTTSGGTSPYTYTIIDDPDNKFQISSTDQLRLLNSVDYLVSPYHTVTIKVVDVNGSEYSRTFLIEVVDPNASGTGGTILNVYNEVNSVPVSVSTLVATYTVPAGKGFNLVNALCSADNVSKFQAKLNSATIQQKRATWNNFNPEFKFVNLEMSAGDKIEIFVENEGDNTASFDATIIGGEYNA